MKDTYTQAEVRQLLYKMLDKNTTMRGPEINDKIDHELRPKMSSVRVFVDDGGVFDIYATDADGDEWKILTISADGVIFVDGIPEETGWTLDSNGELSVAYKESDGDF